MNIWKGVVFYPDVLNGFGNAEFVENSNKFDAVTSLCNSKRLGGLDSGTGFCVGTFGKRLLVYSIENKGSGNCCKLKWDRKFRYPILQLRSFDIVRKFSWDCDYMLRLKWLVLTILDWRWVARYCRTFKRGSASTSSQLSTGNSKTDSSNRKWKETWHLRWKIWFWKCF